MKRRLFILEEFDVRWPSPAFLDSYISKGSRCYLIYSLGTVDISNYLVVNVVAKREFGVQRPPSR
jgi:hypothetical protein